jgi:hypothetical protein
MLTTFAAGMTKSGWMVGLTLAIVAERESQPSNYAAAQPPGSSWLPLGFADRVRELLAAAGGSAMPANPAKVARADR